MTHELRASERARPYSGRVKSDGDMRYVMTPDLIRIMRIGTAGIPIRNAMLFKRTGHIDQAARMALRPIVFVDSVVTRRTNYL